MYIKGLHQTIQKSGYDLIQQKTQNKTGELQTAVAGILNTYGNQLLIFGTSATQLFSINTIHIKTSSERPLFPNQIKLLL